MADSSEELIVPKKLINPVKESGTMRELHRELLFNQKIGKSVLNQKSELQRVMESKRLKMKSNGNNDQLQLGLGQDNNQLSNSTNSNNEFLNVHRRITSHNNQVQD